MSIVLLFDQIAAQINRLNVVGVQPDQFKLLVHFLLCFPLSIALRYFQNLTSRKLYILFWGAFFMLYLGASWIGLVLAQTLTIYAIAKKVSKPFMAITILSFLILGYLHYDRITNADASWKMGFNVVQMMLTCRFVYVGAAAEDGLQFTFLDYLSYVFYFPNIIVGTVPFKAYVEFVNLSGVYKGLGRNFRAAFISLFKALLFVAAEQLIKPKYSFAYFASTEFEQGTLLWRHIACQMIAWCERFKYFLAFKFSQAAMDAQGITYDGENYNNHSLANYRFEIEFSPIKRTKHWNSSVQTWLQTCFYERFSKQKILLTFALSAYWHGFFIVYYVFFIEWAVFNEITKQVYRARNKFAFIPSWMQSILICVFGQLAVNSTATPVGLLQWDKVYKAMSDLGWVAQITMIVLYSFFKLSKWGKSKVD